MQGIPDFFQVTDRLASAGQPTVEQIAQIAEAGYTSAVNLAMHDSDSAVIDEGHIVASLGLSYIHMPVPFEAPNAGHLSKFIRLMDALSEEQIFVHCAVNARVSVFLYKYLTLCHSANELDVTSPLLAKWWPNMDEAW